MKALVLNAVHMEGTKKDTGKPYDFYQVSIASKFEPVALPNMNKTGFGVEVQQIPLSRDCFNKFGTFTLPCELDLVTDVVPRFGRMQTEVVDVRAVQKPHLQNAA
ncbi:MAG: hypothetical protein P4L87_17010 [Formivibrio sp.]|nr:hypothetical protein [Formivibrio sp.]MDR3539812.1 hypothetical protein [Desulfosporosinus sp.]